MPPAAISAMRRGSEGRPTARSSVGFLRGAPHMHWSMYCLWPPSSSMRWVTSGSCHEDGAAGAQLGSA
eukprot:6926629-Heterocapsa_arctica.AAC.1